MREATQRPLGAVPIEYQGRLPHELEAMGYRPHRIHNEADLVGMAMHSPADPPEDSYPQQPGQFWSISDMDFDECPHGRVGRVKWMTKTWKDKGVRHFLYEVAILQLDGTVLRFREKGVDPAVITDRFLRVVREYSDPPHIRYV